MKKTFKIAILICLFFPLLDSSAQDAIFMPHNPTPVHLNPAFTGMHPHKYRLSVQYRDQGRGYLKNRALKYMLFDGEVKLLSIRGDYFSFGLHMDNSIAGTSNFSTSNLLGGLSYSKKLSGDRYRSTSQYLSFGIQTGAGQQKISSEDLTFPDQFNALNGELTNQFSGESLLISRQYLTINTGLSWYYLAQDRYSIMAGISVFHLNQPDISLMEGAILKMQRRWTGMLSGSLFIGEGLSIQPGLVYQYQNRSHTSLIGSQVSLSNLDENDMSVSVGLWMQSGSSVDHSAINSLIITSILSVNELRFGISLSFNTNRLKNLDDGIGAFEFSTVYHFGELPKGRKLICPTL